MSTVIDQKKPVIVDKKQLAGKWQLTIGISNANGAKGFGGRLLTAYKHPLTGKRYPLVDIDGEEKPGYMIGKLLTTFDPEDADSEIILQWLLGHPEVEIDGVNVDERIRSKKVSNSNIKLKNLDRQHMVEIDTENVVHIVLGRLSEDSGPKAIGLQRLRIMLAYFNLPYYDKRNISNAEVEKKLLRNKLKTYAQSTDAYGNFNAIKIKDIFDEVDNYEIHYMVKEMIRTNVIVTNNQVYKYNNVPIGTSFETMIQFFQNSPELYLEAQGKLLPLLRQEGFKV